MLGASFLLGGLRHHVQEFNRASAQHDSGGEATWPIAAALVTLAIVTVLVALVSEIFVASVREAAVTFGMTPAFVGFVVVALVGGAAEMLSALSGARKNRLDLSVGIALGSASQIALFVAPVLVLLSYVIGPAPGCSARNQDARLIAATNALASIPAAAGTDGSATRLSCAGAIGAARTCIAAAASGAPDLLRGLAAAGAGRSRAGRARAGFRGRGVVRHDELL
jgi:Ca2+/H+ antiporter